MTPQESINLSERMDEVMRQNPALRDFSNWETARRLNDFFDRQERPSVIFKPTITCDGSTWCARYGAAMGIGDSPESAMLDFDKNWTKKL